jgi:hypothetical protein
VDIQFEVSLRRVHAIKLNDFSVSGAILSRFTIYVLHMITHLRKNEPNAADLIFVLAGRENRKRYGLELFGRGFAPKVLFSVGRFEIRRFSKLSLPIPLDLLKFAVNIPPPERHFFVLFDGQGVQVEHIQPRRLGTLTEIESLAGWLQRFPTIRSLMIISSKTHLRRISMCSQSLLGEGIVATLVACPEISSGQRKSESTIAALVELFKIVGYWLILKALGSAKRNHARANRGEI